jgi:hypothetical protein
MFYLESEVLREVGLRRTAQRYMAGIRTTL